MAAPFEPSEYTRAPIITVSSGCALANALVDACPKDAPPGVKKAKKHLEATAEKAAADLAARNKALGVYTEEDSRILDNEADRAWGGLRMRLSAMAMLSPAKFPKAKKAAELEATVFPNGTEFLKADQLTQSGSMAAILQHIDEAKLSGEIDAVAGPELLQAVREIQPRYEAMVSERLRRDKELGQNLSETTRGLQAAIVNYATKVIGTIEHDDPATTEWARKALLPILNHREANALRGQRGGGAAEGAAPVNQEKKPA